MKFVHLTFKNEGMEHWRYCEKNHYPFISTKNIKKDFVEVFYDITNFNVSYESISNELKNIYLSYAKFFLIPFFEYESYLENEYFFNMPIKREHEEAFSNQLFDFLLNKLKE